MEQKVREIGSRSVKITDAFWSKIQQKVIDVVIPFQEKVLNDEIPNVEKSQPMPPSRSHFPRRVISKTKTSFFIQDARWIPMS